MPASILALALAHTLAMTASPAAPAQPSEVIRRAPDHVMIWAQDPATAKAVWRELGFTVRDGKLLSEGIANDTVMFADFSYLELLHFAAPAEASGAQAMTELAFVREGPGANSVAIEVADIDDASRAMKAAGFNVAESVPDIVDPDGPAGPQPPRAADWRDFHFGASPVTGVELFFIAYPPDPPMDAAQAERWAARTRHANGARRLSAVWIAVDDLDAEAAAYAHMGFKVGPSVPAPHLGGPALAVSAPKGLIYLVARNRLPKGAADPRRPGPRILGISIEVEDLAKAQAMVGRSYSHVPVYAGPLRRAVLAPTTERLGLFIELHEKAP